MEHFVAVPSSAITEQGAGIRPTQAFHDSVSTSAFSLFAAELRVLLAWETKAGFQGK